MIGEQKTPFTTKIQEYRNYVLIAQAEVNAGDPGMNKFVEAFFSHLITLIGEEEEWLKTASCLKKKNS